jgi:hypothetical protein
MAICPPIEVPVDLRHRKMARSTYLVVSILMVTHTIRLAVRRNMHRHLTFNQHTIRAVRRLSNSAYTAQSRPAKTLCVASPCVSHMIHQLPNAMTNLPLRARSCAGNYFNDLHVYDPVAGAWTDLSAAISGSPPSTRWGHGFTSAGGKLYVFGGSDDQGDWCHASRPPPCMHGAFIHGLSRHV